LRGPWYIIADYKKARRIFERPPLQDEFDLRYGVETSTRVHLTDLKIDSPNWIYAGGYWPTSTAIIREALSALPIRYEDFVFVDFGSEKGRVLLQASNLPFQNYRCGVFPRAAQYCRKQYRTLQERQPAMSENRISLHGFHPV